MNAIDERITKFIKSHHVLNLATCTGNNPWACSCFYAWLKAEAAFVFSSDAQTRHIAEILQNPRVAGTIVLETKVVGKIQGIQFSGSVEQAAGPMLNKARMAYLKRFPYAIAVDTTYWILKAEYIKLTDNHLGFGTKLHWNRGNINIISEK